MKPYLSRYKAEDVILRPGLKYTGFLIVRVDKDDKEETQTGAHYSRILDPLRPRSYRQLHLSGPAYGFSGYFKPVFLEPEDEGSVVGTFFTVLVPLLVFLTMASVLALFVLHKLVEFSSIAVFYFHVQIYYLQNHNLFFPCRSLKAPSTQIFDFHVSVVPGPSHSPDSKYEVENLR
ncbi:unnamed protein product [Cylicostephanus goldi]|uniref:Uncharacterized protein n=1 Tax=Cylicostephanus goldi TaxID=71465 RepID=A0A3P7NRM9_CYLGO|nr:unnamed protein product [Cylicostephanus goldi]